MKNLTVHLGERTYPIYIGADLSALAAWMKARQFSARVLVVTNPVVRRLHARRLVAGLKSAGFTPSLLPIPDGEQHKTLHTVATLYRSALRAGADRRTAVIAFGGGVVGDVAGFFAATYMRGVPLLHVPTTLLAMVDSSVGGKTGVDLPEGKNLAGAFYQPAAVWIDPSVLATLPHRQIANGMAEIIKYGMIADPAFFGRLEKLLNRGLPAAADPVWATLIRISCSIKAGVVEQDEFEQKSVRERLNFGHTFGHALETVTGYRAYLHGEGVALGMVMAGRLAVRQKMFSRAAQERLERLIAAAGLPVKPRQKISSAALLAVMQRDKKNRAGQLRLVLPSRIGSVAVVAAVPRDAVAAVVKNDAR